ncbi:MAG: hypothetical protein RLZZ215_1087 [Pseudomonadota bacterium]
MIANPAQPFETELIFKPQASRLLLSFIVLSHSLVAGSVCWMPLSLFWKWSLVLGIFSAACYSWRLHAGLNKARLQTVIWRELGAWEIATTEAKFKAAQLTQHFSHPWLSILHLKAQKQRWVIIILPDNLDASRRQILRRRLRLLARYPQ